MSDKEKRRVSIWAPSEAQIIEQRKAGDKKDPAGTFHYRCVPKIIEGYMTNWEELLWLLPEETRKKAEAQKLELLMKLREKRR